MSGWISKAANVFRRDVPETPQPFAVECECGQSHSGMRRSRHQHIVCKACGASIFVLPRDVYPPPHFPKKPRKPERPVPDASDDEQPVYRMAPDPPEPPTVSVPELDPVLEPPEPPTKSSLPLPAKRLTRRERLKQREREKEDQKQIPEEPRGPGVVTVVGKYLADVAATLWRDFVAFWTPFRIVGGVVLSIMTLTGIWSLQQSARSQAVVVAKEQYESGLAAVEDQDWIAARNCFELARDAVDLLERQDVEAEQIRQYFRETQAITRMAPVSLFELLEEAATVLQAEGMEAWKLRFETSYQGRWMVIEGPVRRMSSSLGTDSDANVEVVFPWSPAPQVTVTVVAGFAGADQLLPSDGMKNVIFAGELQAFEQIGEDQRWRVQFQPESGFLWGHLETYLGLGFHFDLLRPQREVEALLEQQAKVIGTHP